MDQPHSRYAASDDAAVTIPRYRVRRGFAHRTCAQPGRGRGFTLVELLMVILLVLGIMDLLAMSVVTAAITMERLAPAGERVARAIGAVVVGAGLLLIARASGLG